MLFHLLAICLYEQSIVAFIFIQDIITWHAPLISGLTVSAILATSVSVQFFAKNLAMQRSLQYGLIMLLLSSVLLSICLSLH